ncbi:O-antigen ligase family protein [Serinibacter salmoneus]|uniref:O-antigen ligase-like membrane protein n=1 Tax=Serinibacter salmoneus TaxID=556530 RepID=A0A2A9CY81_9MICO|nr:O-antigen ligase family protein [Serinibacter salmoneus]PFG19101.1 O-antigen ligase-like membrane protein [Serinibacter salmoneus]
MLALAGLLCVSFVTNLAVRNGHASTRPYSTSLTVDITQYSLYGLIALGFWGVLAMVPRERIARAFQVSVWLCGAASLAQYVGVRVGAAPLLAQLGFRVEGVDDTFESLRSGPFLEGQQLGFYAGGVLLVCLWRRYWMSAVVAGALVLFSESTTAYLGLMTGLAAALLLLPRPRVVVTTIAVLAGLAIAALSVPAFGTVVGRQLAKLGFTQFAPDYAWATASLDLRSVKAEVAFAIAQDYPLFGVGPGRFAAYFYQYASEYRLPWRYYNTQTRPIAENAYGHIASELGLIALGAFVIFIATLALAARRVHPVLVALAGFVAIAVSTQSSWTFLPIWAFLGLLAAQNSTRGAESNQAPKPATRARKSTHPST